VPLFFSIFSSPFLSYPCSQSPSLFSFLCSPFFFSLFYFGLYLLKSKSIKNARSLPLFLTLSYFFSSPSVCPQKHQTMLAVYEIKNEISLIVGPHRFSRMSAYCLACGKCLKSRALYQPFDDSFLDLLLAQCLACYKCSEPELISTFCWPFFFSSRPLMTQLLAKMSKFHAHFKAIWLVSFMSFTSFCIIVSFMPFTSFCIFISIKYFTFFLSFFSFFFFFFFFLSLLF
jgi:hypothetical protein